MFEMSDRGDRVVMDSGMPNMTPAKIRNCVL